MEVMKVVCVCVLTLIIYLVLKKLLPELSFFPPMIIAVGILIIAAGGINQILSSVEDFLPTLGLGDEMEILLKVIGICIMTDFLCGLAEDCSVGTLAIAINFFGRVSMVICVLPMVEKILRMAIELEEHI